MNQKQQILDAWITVEHLSEGDIDLRDKKLRKLEKVPQDWEQFFQSFIEMEASKTSQHNKNKCGIVLYFNIFEFEEVIEILRKKNDIEPTYEDIPLSKKFKFCLYLDHNLELISDKVFLTMSGYIYKNHKIPEDIKEVEQDLRDFIEEKLENEGFHQTISLLYHKYNSSIDQFRYGFIHNVERSDSHLHSFFIKDLEQAKSVKSANLERFLAGYTGQRKNLDANNESSTMNFKDIEHILQPKFYPLGRFPSKTEYRLALMQQIAVNASLHDQETMRSVNGPPGTGKTTLLKDIFAELIVQQAYNICQMPLKKLSGSLAYWEQRRIAPLPQNIAQYNILVASSNNGAVQNIVNELPRIEEIGEEYRELLFEADYFTDISNTEYEIEFKEENGTPNPKLKENPLPKKEYWGMFSLEGGRKSNVDYILLILDQMEKHLNNTYVSDENIYTSFKKLFQRVQTIQNKAQSYREDYKRLLSLRVTYQKEKKQFSILKERKRNELESKIRGWKKEHAEIDCEKSQFEEQLLDLDKRIKELNETVEEFIREYELIQDKRPIFFALQKWFKRPKAITYIEKRKKVHEQLKTTNKQKRITEKRKILLEKHLKELSDHQANSEQKITETNEQFNTWKHEQEKRLNLLSEKVNKLKDKVNAEQMNVLDVSQPYEHFQLQNPWFDAEYRELQSKLFIKALKVRKQFLKDNVQHLRAAKNIWRYQSEHLGKSNASTLIKVAWEWINVAIPVISTTFASFRRMFQHIEANSLANLFIDEAGQALPQAGVGAIFRSKQVTAVGDPFQIEPVLPLDSKVLNFIGRKHQVNETFVSPRASIQTLIDRASKYGYQKNEHEWIGIPLWVHRRCLEPMFSISNEISYDNLMVQGRDAEAAMGIGMWIDVSGTAKDKYVKEQSNRLVDLISEKMTKNPTLKDEIYVITPFRNVANRLAKDLDNITFTKRENGKPTNVGTVHTFQGKEAKIVYFVLGADERSQGAASWAVDQANIMNVAATRAKEEFYIIGDEKLYSSLGSQVANTTLQILEGYNKIRN